MQAQLLRYSDKCFLALTKNLDEVGVDCTIESVHKVRLTIKKLHALFGILGYKEEIKALNEGIKRIDQIFINVGLIRDNQVQIELIKYYRNRMGEEVDFIIELLKNDSKKYKETIRRNIRKINPFDFILLNQRIDNTIESLSDSSIEIILKTRMNDLFKQMKEIVSSNPNERTLHRFRIILKDLIYTLTIIKKGIVISEFNKASISYLKNLQQRLGEWHDLKVLCDYVNNIKRESANLINIIEVDKKNKLIDVLNEINKIEGLSLNL